MCDITSKLGGDAGEGDSSIGINLNLDKMGWLDLVKGWRAVGVRVNYGIGQVLDLHLHWARCKKKILGKCGWIPIVNRWICRWWYDRERFSWYDMIGRVFSHLGAVSVLLPTDHDIVGHFESEKSELWSWATVWALTRTQAIIINNALWSKNCQSSAEVGWTFRLHFCLGGNSDRPHWSQNQDWWRWIFNVWRKGSSSHFLWIFLRNYGFVFVSRDCYCRNCDRASRKGKRLWTGSGDAKMAIPPRQLLPLPAWRAAVADQYLAATVMIASGVILRG